MPKPSQLAHIVLKTYDVERLRNWYCDALEANVAYEQLPNLSFITYDDEHHRVAFARFAETRQEISNNPWSPGLLHVAFTYENIRDLLELYEKLRDRKIMPDFTVNHGITLSFYYRDPDNNSVEFQVDRFSTAAEAQSFIDRMFDKNPIGVPCDPELLLERMKSGASDEELLEYDANGPMAVPPYPELTGIEQ